MSDEKMTSLLSGTPVFGLFHELEHSGDEVRVGAPGNNLYLMRLGKSSEALLQHREPFTRVTASDHREACRHVSAKMIPFCRRDPAQQALEFFDEWEVHDVPEVVLFAESSERSKLSLSIESLEVFTLPGDSGADEFSVAEGEGEQHDGGSVGVLDGRQPPIWVEFA